MRTLLGVSLLGLSLLAAVAFFLGDARAITAGWMLAGLGLVLLYPDESTESASKAGVIALVLVVAASLMGTGFELPQWGLVVSRNDPTGLTTYLGAFAPWLSAAAAVAEYDHGLKRRLGPAGGALVLFAIVGLVGWASLASKSGLAQKATLVVSLLAALALSCVAGAVARMGRDVARA